MSRIQPPIDEHWRENIDSLVRYYAHYDELSTTKWDPNDAEVAKINDLCTQLILRDYKKGWHIDNAKGELCGTYPLKIAVPLSPSKSSPTADNKLRLRLKNEQAYTNLINDSRFARVRTRFPLPVLVVNGRLICRSSTLSQKLECTLQSGVNSLKDAVAVSLFQSSEVKTSTDSLDSDSELEFDHNNYRSTVDKHRSFDIDLIQGLGVTHICDFMVENTRKKYGVTICSSEKNDRHGRYNRFRLLSMPYPGVEFFNNFKINNPDNTSKSMVFDWNKAKKCLLNVDEEMCVMPMINWQKYKQWDITTLTQNYLLRMLYLLCDDETGGILIHCISGWDRTPMFISLLRILLWADGLVHASLTAEEMLYLTIGYDWMLFRHHFSDRQRRGEDIFMFTFYMLCSLKEKTFSLHHIKTQYEENKKNREKNFNNTYKNEDSSPSSTTSSSAAMPMRSIIVHASGGPVKTERVELHDAEDDIQCGSWQLMSTLDLSPKNGSLGRSPLGFSPSPGTSNMTTIPASSSPAMFTPSPGLSSHWSNVEMSMGSKATTEEPLSRSSSQASLDSFDQLEFQDVFAMDGFDTRKKKRHSFKKQQKKTDVFDVREEKILRIIKLFSLVYKDVIVPEMGSNKPSNSTDTSFWSSWGIDQIWGQDSKKS